MSGWDSRYTGSRLAHTGEGSRVPGKVCVQTARKWFLSGCFLFSTPVGTTPQVNSCSVSKGSDNRHCDGGGVGIELFTHEDVRCPEEAGVAKELGSPPEPFVRIWRPHPGLLLATVVQQWNLLRFHKFPPHSTKTFLNSSSHLWLWCDQSQVYTGAMEVWNFA